MQIQDLKPAMRSIHIYAACSPCETITVSSGWYQDRRAFFRSLPSSATKVRWITLLFAALQALHPIVIQTCTLC